MTAGKNSGPGWRPRARPRTAGRESPCLTPTVPAHILRRPSSSSNPAKAPTQWRTAGSLYQIMRHYLLSKSVEPPRRKREGQLLAASNTQASRASFCCWPWNSGAMPDDNVRLCGGGGGGVDGGSCSERAQRTRPVQYSGGCRECVVLWADPAPWGYRG